MNILWKKFCLINKETERNLIKYFFKKKKMKEDDHIRKISKIILYLSRDTFEYIFPYLLFPLEVADGDKRLES